MAEMCKARIALGAVEARCGLCTGHEGRHSGQASGRVRDFGPTPTWHTVWYVIDWADDPEVKELEV